MEKRELKAAVPKFDKVPWLSEASLTNKPLVISLPNRSHSSAAFLTSWRRHMNSPTSFQGPDVSSKDGRNQSDPWLLRNKWLCSACREVKMAQPRTMTIPDDLKLSFKNLMNHRMMNLRQSKAQAMPKPSCDDMLTESIHYRLPIVGPRTGVFHGLLSDVYRTLQETQHPPLPRKKPNSKAIKR
ncbi:PREDICTED: uncharacterized protein C1orf105 homolog [Chinchilla lanigera]|uniref:Chromosome 1 open reading frame 105 n=1 Tax=Chinchilla lanigera TaxID=34839 RepID=A0A8C2VKJ4_CHILA|nr:PREDICTED: uncharacterized protein C1orf105 homolog [Chinchilla lanigera]